MRHRVHCVEFLEEQFRAWARFDSPVKRRARVVYHNSNDATAPIGSVLASGLTNLPECFARAVRRFRRRPYEVNGPLSLIDRLLQVVKVKSFLFAFAALS